MVVIFHVLQKKAPEPYMDTYLEGCTCIITHLVHTNLCFYCNPTFLKPPNPCVSDTSTCVLPLVFLLPPFFARFILFPLCVSPVPVQLAEQQHGQPGEPRNVRQPLQLREHLFIGRAYPLALLPAQLHFWGPVSRTGHPLQHRLPRAARLPGVLPAVQHRQISHMDCEYKHTHSLLWPWCCATLPVHTCTFFLFISHTHKYSETLILTRSLTQVSTSADSLCAGESKAGFGDSSCLDSLKFAR